MLLRSAKVIHKRMSNIEVGSESEENRQEMMEPEENINKRDGATEGKQMENEEDVKFKQMISLVIEINQKINREIKEVKKEFKQDLEEILWEVRGASEKQDNKWMDMRNEWEMEVKEMKMA